MTLAGSMAAAVERSVLKVRVTFGYFLKIGIKEAANRHRFLLF